MYKQRTFLRLALLASLLGVVGVQQGRAQAAQTMFEQRINPLACTVSVVQAGSSPFTSSNCGPYVPISPQSNDSPAATPPSTATSVPRTITVYTPSFGPKTAKPSSGGSAQTMPQNIYLNDLGQLDKAGGYMLQVMPGSVFSFRLIQEGSAGRVRSFTVHAVGNHAFVLIGAPGGTVVRVSVGDQKRLDLDGDGVVDVSLRAEFISEDGRTGVLRAVFYAPALPDRVLRDPTHEITFVVVFSAVLIGASHLYHRLRRSPLAHREWLTYRDHEPPKFYAY